MTLNNIIAAYAVHADAHVTDIHDMSIVKCLPNEKQWTERMKFIYEQRTLNIVLFMVVVAFGIYFNIHRNHEQMEPRTS